MVTFYVLRSTFCVSTVLRGFSAGSTMESHVHLPIAMAATRFQELEAWQLANEVKREVFTLTEAGPATTDFRFRDQLRGSAASAPRNIAEGFGRFRPKDFARGCEIASGELHETESSLLDGLDRKYFAEADVRRIVALTQRARMVNTRLILYLRTCMEPKPRRPKTGA